TRRMQKLDAATLARQHTPAAIAALVRGLDDPDKYVASATALLDRGWGKPAQTQHITSESSVVVQHLLAARQVALELPTIDAKPVDTQATTHSAVPEE